VIDQNYRGEIKFRFKKALAEGDACGISYNGTLTINDLRKKYYKVGDRIGQIIIQAIPHITFTEVDELEESNRGAAGYGSSGV